MGRTNEAVVSGLEGVVVASTRMSDVDGEGGRLVICGHDAESLARTHTFEEVCALLWHGRGEAAHDVQAALARARVLAFSRLERLGDALAIPDGMDALRAAIAHLRVDDANPVGLTAAMAVFAAAWSRTVRGLSRVEPDPTQSHAGDYLRMLRGETVSVELEHAMGAYLTTVSDHGMNASTFTARVVASTGSDMVSAVVAALGALKGPLHGGAPGPVLDMLDAIAVPDRAESWLLDEVAAGRRIMGMGHRIYRVRDPRAAVFEHAIERLETTGITTGRLKLARAVEQAATGVLRRKNPDRPLHANVEFYTAVLLDALGIPREAFTPTFAVGRVSGWCAHVEEQRREGRLIRPASVYVGPALAL